MKFPKKLIGKIEQRIQENAFRTLSESLDLVDFVSNDYLGFASNTEIYHRAKHLMGSRLENGSKGSRLLSGNHPLYGILEAKLQEIYHASALVFNSGYNANIGLLGSIPQRDDLILYDEYAHASLREGTMLSKARSYKFLHNDLDHLRVLCEKYTSEYSEIYVVVESVYSMDGDSPDLEAFVAYSQQKGFHLIVDEAHALGVFGLGLIHTLGLSEQVFATVLTFGKALGCHGAAIVGGDIRLKDYLVNFARSFIYTTALPPHALATILVAYEVLIEKNELRKKLTQRIKFFRETLSEFDLSKRFVESQSAIQVCLLNDINLTRETAHQIRKSGYDVRAILSPTVPFGRERLRFCLHSYNSKEDIREVLSILASFII